MKRIIPIIVLIAALGGGYWWYTQPTLIAQESTGTPALTGSGSIEAETVAITAELGGRVIEIKVDEGDEVTAGQVLVELDKSSLLAQKTQLEATLSTAQANLELAGAPPRPEDVAAARANLAQAETARDGAKLTWQRAQALANNPHQLETSISQAQLRVTQAEKNLELARVNLKRMEIETEAASRDQSSHAALVQYEAAQKRLQAARLGVSMSEVALAGAKTQVEHLTQMRNRPLQLIAQANAAQAAYQQAQAAVLAAQANLSAVKAGPTPEDIAVAQAQVQEAKTALAAVNVQLKKQTLTAPRAGLITQKLVNPGELASPGAMLLELSDIDTVELVVYIPETQIGRVKIGQKAQVYVDAYESDVFEGTVSFIAHEAEFTPRNVQTQEERVNLVFAVKITLDNAGHRLKPGMPADAEILPALSETVEQTDNAFALPTTAQVRPSPTPAATATPTPGSATATATAPPTLVKATPTPYAQVASWGLNVRSGPGVDYQVVDILAQGDIVSIIEVDPETGWLHVQLPSGQKSGWISDNPDYVTVK